MPRKGENIYKRKDGRYKIGDFGVSKILKDSSKAESLKGTPNFLAPEVYLGKEGYTKSVDLYSLGILHIVQTLVITVCNDCLALFLKLFQVVNNTATKKRVPIF